MSLLGRLISGTIKVAVSPLAVTKDILNAGETNATGESLDSILDDAKKGIDDLSNGDLI